MLGYEKHLFTNKGNYEQCRRCGSASHNHAHKSNPHSFRWLATADKKFGYFLSRRIVPNTTSWWDSWVYRDIRPGDRVLLFQTFGGASDSLRGIYGAAEVIGIRRWNRKTNNIRLRYVGKFPSYVPLHKPYAKRIRTLASRLEKSFLRKRIMAEPQEIRGFIPITRHDRPLVTRIMDLAQRSIEEAVDRSNPNTVVGKEGKKAYQEILRRERNGRLIREAKAAFASRHGGRLYCQACGFDFSKKYGDRGAGFIECHHKVPVSSFKREKTTSLRDLVLLCSNCHSMVHNRLPWLTMGQLRALMK